jgi:hypothetical protein
LLTRLVAVAAALVVLGLAIAAFFADRPRRREW